MINKIISLVVIFSLLISNSFAEPFVYYSDRKEANENIFNFQAEILHEKFSGLLFDLAYFPMTDLPNNMPKEFIPIEPGLFCLNVNEYDNMITIVKTNKFNLDSVIASERKNCKEKKENIRKGCQEREDSLKKKIQEVEGKLKKKTDDFILKQEEYKSLEKKMFWVQMGSGVAILAISGFAIYSSQK